MTTTTEKCFAWMCFTPLDAAAPKFFGFSEFLAGLALLVLAWTIADVRYRFRVRTAPVPLQGITFSVVSVIGVLTLLTDVWRAEQWLVPTGRLLTPGSWQALLGGLFLCTFLTWAWFAFIRPPTYGPRNAERFAQTVFNVVLRGSPAELAVIADEMTWSAKALVRYATDQRHRTQLKHQPQNEIEWRPPDVEAYANDILLMLADKRFCRAIVESSPATALAVFHEIGETKKYGIQIATFGTNLVEAAIANRDSFLFHEADGYRSGLLGFYKPLSQAMFSNYDMVEAIGSLLDPDYEIQRAWKADQWDAYGRAVLMVLRSYIERRDPHHSFVLSRAIGCLEHAVSDLYKIDGVENSSWDDDIQARLRVVVEFIEKAVDVLNSKNVPEGLRLRIRGDNNVLGETIYDQISDFIFAIILAASAVKGPQDHCWWIQHNSVWAQLYNFSSLKGDAGTIIKFKLRRLLYNEIVRMSRFANFKGARILAFCLNVMGLKVSEGEYESDSRALQVAVLRWTKKNFVWLHKHSPHVAEACLVDGMTYDPVNRRILSSRALRGLRRKPHYVYLDLDPVSDNSAGPVLSV